MLRRAEKELNLLYPNNAKGIKYFLVDLDFAGEFYRQYQTQVSNVVSLISLQHSVAPIQAHFLEQLCDILAVDGLGMLEFPQGGFRSSCDFETDIEAGGMQMHALPQETVTQHLNRRGCKILGIEEIGGRYAGRGENIIVTFIKTSSTIRK